MIIKAKSYFATAFFMNSREIVGLPLSLVIVGLVFYVMLGFNPGIQKHKALAHDMHAESNALQQRSAPQPVLRSSWLQLARFNKGSRRNQRALKGVPLSSWLQLALYVFLKTSESEGNNKDLGKIKRNVHNST